MNSNKTIMISSLMAFSAIAHIENTDIESDERHSNDKMHGQQFARYVAPTEQSALYNLVCTEETVITPHLPDRGDNSASNSDTRLYLEPSELSTCDVIIENDIKYFADLDRALLEAGKLKINWDNDQGLPPGQNVIHDARKFLTFLKSPTQICPVPDGSINVSKIFGDNLLDVEIDGSGIASVFFGADPHNPLFMEVMEINDSNVAQIQLLISKS